MDIKVTLRNGNEYFLALAESEAEGLFAELVAERSQALRGWVSVTSEKGARSVVRGEEIVELHLVHDDEDP